MNRNLMRWEVLILLSFLHLSRTAKTTIGAGPDARACLENLRDTVQLNCQGQNDLIHIISGQAGNSPNCPRSSPNQYVNITNLLWTKCEGLNSCIINKCQLALPDNCNSELNQVEVDFLCLPVNRMLDVCDGGQAQNISATSSNPIYVTTPGYTQKTSLYPPSTDCALTITTTDQNEEQFELTVLSLIVEQAYNICCYYDYLSATAKGFDQGIVFEERGCGAIREQSSKFTANEITFNFHSDYQEQFTGGIVELRFDGEVQVMSSVSDGFGTSVTPYLTFLTTMATTGDTCYSPPLDSIQNLQFLQAYQGDNLPQNMTSSKPSTTGHSPPTPQQTKPGDASVTTPHLITDPPHPPRIDDGRKPAAGDSTSLGGSALTQDQVIGITVGVAAGVALIIIIIIAVRKFGSRSGHTGHGRSRRNCAYKATDDPPSNIDSPVHYCTSPPLSPKPIEYQEEDHTYHYIGDQQSKQGGSAAEGTVPYYVELLPSEPTRLNGTSEAAVYQTLDEAGASNTYSKVN